VRNAEPSPTMVRISIAVLSPTPGWRSGPRQEVGYQPGLAVAGQGGPLSVDLTQLSG
jgi:hypothetical protein